MNDEAQRDVMRRPNEELSPREPPREPEEPPTPPPTRQYREDNDGREKRKRGGNGGPIALLIVTLAALAGCVSQISLFPSILLVTIWLAMADISIAQAPQNTFGVVRSFKRRTGRIVREGLTFVYLWQTIQLFSRQLQTIPLKATFMSRNGIRVFADILLQYRGDPELNSPDGNTFSEMSETIIESGLGGAVQSALGALGDHYAGEEFKQNKAALEQMLNATMRLEKPPHVAEGIHERNAIEYYLNRSVGVQEMIDTEERRRNEYSEYERRYGIDVTVVKLTTVSFSPEIESAFETKQLVEAKKEAATSRLTLIKEYMMDDKATFQEASDAVDGVLGTSVGKQVVSIHGAGSSLTEAAALLQGLGKKGGV